MKYRVQKWTDGCTQAHVDGQPEKNAITCGGQRHE